MTDLHALSEHINAAQGDAIVARGVHLDQLVFTVKREKLHSFVSFLKSDEAAACQQLLAVCGADYPARVARFDVVYNLLSLTKNHRIRVIVEVPEGASVASLVDLYPAAGWFERETFDMYGIEFDGHPDLRRILTDYGFEGFPLRKDFPLTGFVELRYDEKRGRIVQEPVKLMQDYRNFDFASPWEGMTTMQLPGDEKARKPKVGAK